MQSNSQEQPSSQQPMRTTSLSHDDMEGNNLISDKILFTIHRFQVQKLNKGFIRIPLYNAERNISKPSDNFKDEIFTVVKEEEKLYNKRIKSLTDLEELMKNESGVFQSDADMHVSRFSNSINQNYYQEYQLDTENVIDTIDSSNVNYNNMDMDSTDLKDENNHCREFNYIFSDDTSFMSLHKGMNQDSLVSISQTYDDIEINEDIDKKKSVINGEVYPNRGKSSDHFYEGTDLKRVLLSDPYSILDVEKEYDVKREIRKQSARCEHCDKECRSLNALNHHMLVHSEERPHVCRICQKAFKEQPTLRRHMWTHMAKQHQCDICKKFFVEKSSLRRHMSTIHADFRPDSRAMPPAPKQSVACPKCSKVFKSFTKYNMHCQMHGNPNFECQVCGKVYAGRSHLKIHQRIHTGEKPFQCTLCDSKFAFKHVLKSHQARIHHRVSRYKCNICSLTFLKKSDLSSHASGHMVPPPNGKKNYNLQKHPRRCDRDEVKRLLQRNMLYSKASLENPEYPLFSQLIGSVPETGTMQESRSPSQLTNAPIKTESDKYICSLVDQDKKEKRCLKCKKEFERMGDLKRHIISHIVQEITSKAKESIPHYECSICGLSNFRQVDKFKAHLREHAKLTLYKCKLCQRAFGDSSNYSKHKKVHGNKFLQCDLCRRKFNTKRMLISHMEYHELHPPMRCDYCNKLFYFPSSFRKHLKISHEGKANVTYRCENCGGRFSSVKLKWEHQWEKHGMRKVRADCATCGARFRKLSLLRAHTLHTHSSQPNLPD